jgi:hypothetical protein
LFEDRIGFAVDATFSQLLARPVPKAMTGQSNTDPGAGKVPSAVFRPSTRRRDVFVLKT